MRIVAITLPYFYRYLAGGNEKLYVDYAKGYIKRNHPELKPKQIRGSSVICERREKV